ncbi:MAG TPA: bifunctional YncE family protein/alkaline phosphatase family protein [Terriglobales bacterium]|nr:bifunctional YncE family protein/alkaline phosphatase family protein [Terriglobales bacterium]
MKSLRLFACVLLVVLFSAATIPTGAEADAVEAATYTAPLSTGVRLDAVGDAIDLGSMPLAMAIAPGGDKLAVVLSGWREQGLQIVDLKSRQVVQTLIQPAAFLGIGFSRDGRELFVSGGNDDTIFCYSWRDGTAALERKIVLAEKAPEKPGSRYPAGLAVSRTGNYLYVAENVGDSLAVVDVTTSKVVQRFPTDHYPYAVEAAANGKVYVSAWAADTVAEFQTKPDGLLTPLGKLKVGPRPSALLSNRTGSRLFAVLAGTDQIAVVDTTRRTVLRYLSDAAPAGPAEGSTPNALALSHDESQLFVAEADNNAVAVFDVSEKRVSENHVSEKHSGTAPSPLMGRIPADWYPTAVLDAGGQVLVLNGKGHGSHANPDGPIPGEGIKRPLGYALGQLNGTLRSSADQIPSSTLAEYSRRVAEANNWQALRVRKTYPPFKHVVYIIKENRTYDQVLGDLKEGDGDPALVFFGQAISPNHHALALRFGLFDRFFTNAEVSSQGHIWSTAAYVTDFGEKTIPSAYSGKREGVDGEEIDEPINGFLWTLARKKGISFRDYGEMVKVPEGWPVTQREVVPYVSPTYPAFDLKTSDQARADAWIAELEKFVRDGKMPSLEVMHLPSDHTAGGRAGFRTPRAFMADNDLALGRIVEALSKSPFWKDTVIFVLEDDSQSGPDHIDSHRSCFFAISAYNRPGTIHRFANTTDVVAAIEDILGLGRLSQFDYFSRSLADIFVETPDLSPWTAIVPQVDMNETNAPATTAARASEGLDFSAPDRVDDTIFNQILWSMMKGSQSLPETDTKAPLHAYRVGR